MILAKQKPDQKLHCQHEIFVYISPKTIKKVNISQSNSVSTLVKNTLHVDQCLLPIDEIQYGYHCGHLEILVIT